MDGVGVAESAPDVVWKAHAYITRKQHAPRARNDPCFQIYLM